MIAPSTEQTGLLLVNLGTPRSPSVPDVREYLREFLSDPHVISMPAPLRWLLLNAVILRTRPAKSAHAYQSIWSTTRGSPLLFHSEDLLQAVQSRMPDVHVALAMRYGAPTIKSGLEELKKAGVARVCVFPLYPQFALASTQTVIDKVVLEATQLGMRDQLTFVPPFFDDDATLDVFASIYRRTTSDYQPDHVLLSFHGLPEQHVRMTDPTKQHCLNPRYACCDVDVPANARCYRRQCLVSAQGLVERLDLDKVGYTMCFQSRLRDSWMRPYTDEVLIELAKAGKKRLVVMAPAFVADCLETLEEIEMRAKESFLEHGGEDLRLVPSLNSEPAWADALVNLARRAAPFLAAKQSSAA
jgi:protoporphyrin/coproporphyrin ferrochelatase